MIAAVAAAMAGTYADDFASDANAWSGGEVAGGVLAVDDGEAAFAPGPASSFTLTARVRLREGTVLRFGPTDAPLVATYLLDGMLTLGDATLPFPVEQTILVPDAEPVLGPDGDGWDGADTLHCDVVWDEATATWFLFWTGAMSPGYGYRQIGVATSTDLVTWTEYAGNPVLTIDYDRSTVDGIHVHMPTVAIAGGTWHMLYSCYQNDVGNRLCHATSDDGFAWETHGVALDFGEAAAFDSAGLRMPDVHLGDDGTWHLLYNGTVPDQHYGPTGYATSSDGWTWTRHGAITADEYRLQGGGMVAGPYGVEQWWNCEDVFCHSRADPADLSTWVDSDGVALEKGWADWSGGYVQAPSAQLVDGTWHLWFNAYGQGDDGTTRERLGHARSVPVPGAWLDLAMAWDGATLSLTLDGASITTPLAAFDALVLAAEGVAELDEIALSWEAPPVADTGDTGETGALPDDSGGDGGGDTGTPSPSARDVAGDGGCGCRGVGAGGLGAACLALAVATARRSRRGSR